MQMVAPLSHGESLVRLVRRDPGWPRFASRPAVMGQVLGIVYRVIATHLIKKAGLTHKTAHTGAVTLIQRFGSALNVMFISTCCSSMGRMWSAPTALPDFAG